MLYRIGEALRQGAGNLRRRAVAVTLFAALAVALLSPIVTAKNMFVIVDGNSLTVHNTYTGDAAQALAEAGIHISQYDYVSMPEAPVSGGVVEVFIERSHTVTLEADGKTAVLSTLGQTVGEVLERTGTTLGRLDVVTPNILSPVSEGMVITVTRYDTRIEQVTEEIPFETMRTADKSINVGLEKVTQAGILGQKVLTYEISLRDGIEFSRRLQSEVLTQEPQDELISYGIGGTVVLPSGERVKYKRMLTCTATAYSSEKISNKLTAMGTIARVGAIAVDPKVIPLGSRVYVEGANGKWVYGVAVCEDTGGVIKGNKIDLFFDTEAECWKFGVKKANVYILE